jgi:hypothetical protein
MRKFLALTALLMLMSVVTVMACGGDGQKTGTSTSAMINSAMINSATINSESPQQVTLKGQLVCSTCSLKAEGAHSDCKDFGHTRALKTSDGRMITLMPNQYSKLLLSDMTLNNKPIEITGTYFANANMLDVQSYSIDGGKTMSWCDRDKTMDACKTKTLGSY